ncbi:S-layer homology domain-containing protein [Paenibacillus sp. Lou8.1]|uniref:S-layer homology domain-containing protein n=1 Tax=Paenibacillus sp. Lou8.1 TaxID=2962041 RepID=UPI0020B8FAA1|nr:S-layer homology domain-containing protein [Paenibacillus sp. Lou8.1]MCP3807774.1 S-layer homology domain-containing protein [Paenibacillus sp. Lou8.1]
MSKIKSFCLSYLAVIVLFGTWTWSFSGSAVYATSSPVPSVTDAVYATETTVTSWTNPSKQGQSVTFSIKTISTPQITKDLTGTVVLMDGTNILDTLTMTPNGIANGYATATYTTSNLSVGSHPITAIYSGDARFAPSTSEAYIQVINGDADTGNTGGTGATTGNGSSSSKKDKKDSTDSSESISSSETTTPSSPSVLPTDLPTTLEIKPVDQPEVMHEKYITGYHDGTFRPDQSITRAETATMMARIMKLETKEGSTTYKDVPSTYWAKDSIIALTTQHFMNGYADGTFRPEQPITRAEMAAILASWKQLKGTQTAASPYTDIEKHWARDSIKALAEAGWITGFNDSSFQPNQYITRVETVTILNTILKRGPLEGTTQATWKDVPADYWAFKNIEEASRTHTSTINPEGTETIVN